MEEYINKIQALIFYINEYERNGYRFINVTNIFTKELEGKLEEFMQKVYNKKYKKSDNQHVIYTAGHLLENIVTRSQGL